MYQPAVDSILVVSLPGETIRAPVTQVLDNNTVFVTLETTPLNPAKVHSWRKDDVVACRRKPGLLGDMWEAYDDRVLYARPPEVVEPPLPPKRKGPPPISRKLHSKPKAKRGTVKGGHRAPAIRK